MPHPETLLVSSWNGSWEVRAGMSQAWRIRRGKVPGSLRFPVGKTGAVRVRTWCTQRPVLAHSRAPGHHQGDLPPWQQTLGSPISRHGGDRSTASPAGGPRDTVLGVPWGTLLGPGPGGQCPPPSAQSSKPHYLPTSEQTSLMISRKQRASWQCNTFSGFFSDGRQIV